MFRNNAKRLVEVNRYRKLQGKYLGLSQAIEAEIEETLEPSKCSYYLQIRGKEPVN